MDLMSYLLGKNSSSGGGGVDILDYFNDTINFNTASNKQYSYLVKKMPPLKIVSTVTSLVYAFTNYQGETIKFDFENSDFSNVTNTSIMFQNCINLKEVDMSGLVSSKIASINGMFFNCTEIRKIDLSGLTNVANYNGGEAFSGCNKLAVLDISSLSKPATFAPSYYQDMFYNCGTNCLQSDGAYADGVPYIYVKDADMQTWILTQRTDWTTANVIVKE